MRKLILSIIALATFAALWPHDASAVARKFFKPTLFGDTLAACTGASSGCGKPVADKFCQQKGFNKALSYQLNRNPTGNLRARTIDNNLVTVSSSTPSFVFVKCFTPQTADRR